MTDANRRLLGLLVLTGLVAFGATGCGCALVSQEFPCPPRFGESATCCECEWVVLGEGSCYGIPVEKADDEDAACGRSASISDLLDEARRNPELIGSALEAARLWRPALEASGPGAVVTEEMAAALDEVAVRVLAVSDHGALTRAARVLRSDFHQRALIGRPVSEVTADIMVALTTAGSSDGQLRLSERERGLVRSGETVVIPAAARAAGAQGTRWRTEAVLTAVGPATAQVTIALLPRGQGNPDPVTVDLAIEGGRSLVLRDVLADLFGVEGAAALRIHCRHGAVGVTSRTFNLQGADPRTSPTFGQFLPALTTDDAIVAGDEGRLLQLAHDPTLEAGQRTNLILVNGGGAPVTVEVVLHEETGTALGTVTRTLAAWEYEQLDRVFEEVTGEQVPGGWAAVRVLGDGGRVFALASVVDNLTGDPIAVPAVLRSPLEATSLAETQVVPAVARAGGFANTDWRSDLVLHGMVGPVATAQVTLLPRDRENTEPVSTTVQVPEGQSQRFEDVLGGLFDTEGAASLWVTTYGGGIGVSSRTFNRLGAGNDAGFPAGATFGQYLGPIGFTRSFGFGEEAWIAHLSHDPSLTAGSRSNLGLVSGSVGDIEIEVVLHRGDGTVLGAFTQTLRQWENLQLNRVFERVTTEPVEFGYAVVRTATPSGRFQVYGSVVDNRTGDPITVDAIPLRRPEAAGVVASGNMLMELFEAGLRPADVFELLRADGVGAYFDRVSAIRPEQVTRTGAGVRYDLGAGIELGGRLFASGRISIDDATATDGERVTGTLVVRLDGAAVDGRSPLVEEVQLGLDLARVGADGVAGTVTIAGSGSAKAVDALSGEVEFDTRVCELYPVGGEIRATIQGEERLIRFSDRCDGGWEAVIPSASYYELNLPVSNCTGSPAPDPLVVYLVEEDGQLAVDPGSAPQTGRRTFSAAGAVTSTEASVRFAQKAGPGVDGVRRTGRFQGERQFSGGELIYYTGPYGGAVSEGECVASDYSGREDPDFSPGVLQACDGPCWRR